MLLYTNSQKHFWKCVQNVSTWPSCHHFSRYYDLSSVPTTPLEWGQLRSPKTSMMREMNNCSSVLIYSQHGSCDISSRSTLLCLMLYQRLPESLSVPGCCCSCVCVCGGGFLRNCFIPFLCLLLLLRFRWYHFFKEDFLSTWVRGSLSFSWSLPPDICHSLTLACKHFFRVLRDEYFPYNSLCLFYLSA